MEEHLVETEAESLLEAVNKELDGDTVAVDSKSGEYRVEIGNTSYGGEVQEKGNGKYTLGI